MSPRLFLCKVRLEIPAHLDLNNQDVEVMMSRILHDCIPPCREKDVGFLVESVRMLRLDQPGYASTADVIGCNRIPVEVAAVLQQAAALVRRDGNLSRDAPPWAPYEMIAADYISGSGK